MFTYKKCHLTDFLAWLLVPGEHGSSILKTADLRLKTSLECTHSRESLLGRPADMKAVVYRWMGQDGEATLGTGSPKLDS